MKADLFNMWLFFIFLTVYSDAVLYCTAFFLPFQVHDLEHSREKKTEETNLHTCVGTFHLYTNLACPSVYLYPINVKTAEPIGPKFCVRPHVTPRKVYDE